MLKRISRVLLMACIFAASTAHASPATEQARCIGLYGVSGLYPTYLVILTAAKGAGLLRDRLYAHGLLNDALDRVDGFTGNSAWGKAIAGSGELGAVTLVVLSQLDRKCLKAGIDAVFDEQPPPTRESFKERNGPNNPR